MSAYLIVQAEITNLDGFRAYQQGIGGRLAAFGAKIGVSESAARTRYYRLKRWAVWTEAEDDVIRGRMYDDRPGWGQCGGETGSHAGCVQAAGMEAPREGRLREVGIRV